MLNSNQYPGLHWEPHDEPVHGGLIARPHGDDAAGLARVYFKVSHPAETQWVWTVGWLDRFHEHGGCKNQDAAIDAATVAYWDGIEATEGWRPAPIIPPPAPDLVAILFWRRLNAWLDERASRADVVAQIHRYRHAAVSGPTIIDPKTDRAVWTLLSDSLHRFR